jgi:hypothetical protein
MPTEELMPDADSQDRKRGSVHPVADPTERGVAPLEAESPAAQHHPVRVQFFKRRRVRNDGTLYVQVTKDPVFSVGPLTAVV